MRPDLPNFRLRRAVQEDAAAIASVLLEAFSDYRHLYTTAGFAATTPTPEQIIARMEEGPIWVALKEMTVIGTVSAVEQCGALYIRGMAVQPSARGLHLGELLLLEVESYASEKNLSRLFLSTTPFLDSAIALYRKFGFVRTDDGPHDLFGTPLLTMEKWT